MIKFHIKELRAATNMTQSELIDKSGIREGTLSAYENSKTISIKTEHLDKLCEIFHCQPSDIMTYENPCAGEEDYEFAKLQSEWMKKVQTIHDEAFVRMLALQLEDEKQRLKHMEARLQILEGNQDGEEDKVASPEVNI